MDLELAPGHAVLQAGGDVELVAIYSSPLERALQTAHALARYQACVVHEDDNLLEVDFGRWTGHSFVELEADPAWAWAIDKVLVSKDVRVSELCAAAFSEGQRQK